MGCARNLAGADLRWVCGFISPSVLVRAPGVTNALRFGGGSQGAGNPPNYEARYVQGHMNPNAGTG